MRANLKLCLVFKRAREYREELMHKQIYLGWLITVYLVFAAMEPARGEVADRSQIIDMEAPIEAVVGELEFRECRVSARELDRKVQCAWYAVPENPEVKDGKHIKLFVIRLPARRHVKNVTDPVLFIAGGPGQSASESYLFADHIWSALAKNRDFYLIDQRGTGYSNYMGCDEIQAQEIYTEMKYDAARVKELVKSCLAEMPGDPRYYTTDISVQDFEKVRAALGVKEWNLLGVSYGTRVSTHYMRRFPQSLRSVVLDSVVPPQHVLGTEIATRSQHMLEVLLKRCEESDPCSERMPNLQQDVLSLLAKLEKAPMQIRVENFTTGAIEDMTFTRDHLVTLVRLYLYSPNTLAVLPPMLHEAAQNGNYSPLARAAMSIIENLQSSISTGLHNSVMCTEEYPYFDQISEEDKVANQQSYMGEDLITQLTNVCSVWPRGEKVAEMKEPLVSAVPTLLVSGEYDPITPPDYAEQTLAKLEQATHLVLPGQGHFVSGIGCMPDLIDKFINDTSAEWLNVGCLQRLSAAPLFLNFNGTAP